jgi:hypothetical protein
MSFESTKTNRSHSPITNDIMNDLLKEQRITTPTRNKLPKEKDLTPVSKELKPLKDTMRKISSLQFPNLDSIDSQDIAKTDSTSSTISEEEIKQGVELYDKNLKNTKFKNFQEKMNDLKKRTAEREEKYKTMSEEEVKKAEDKRSKKNILNFKLQNWVNKGLTKKQERGGRRNKRKTKRKSKKKTKRKGGSKRRRGEGETQEETEEEREERLERNRENFRRTDEIDALINRAYRIPDVIESRARIRENYNITNDNIDPHAVDSMVVADEFQGELQRAMGIMQSADAREAAVVAEEGRLREERYAEEIERARERASKKGGMGKSKKKRKTKTNNKRKKTQKKKMRKNKKSKRKTRK